MDNFAYIPLTGKRPAKYDSLKVPADSPIMRKEYDLEREILSRANYIHNRGSRSLELARAWDDNKFGRSVMANVMRDEKWKCAHRMEGKGGPNEFMTDMFPNPTTSHRRGQARRNLRARLLATGNYSHCE